MMTMVVIAFVLGCAWGAGLYVDRVVLGNKPE